MKQIAVCLTLMTVALLAAKPADAALVIDDFAKNGFAGGSSTIVTPMQDSISSTITRTLSFETGSGNFTVLSGAIGGFFMPGTTGVITYVFDTPVSLHDYTMNHLLELNLFNNILGVGDWSVVVSYTTELDWTAKSPTAYFEQVDLVGTGAGVGTLQFDGRDLGDGALASNVKSLAIEITYANTNSDMGEFSSGPNGGIAAVPEPATMALLLPTLAGGLGMVWRRRRNAVASEAKI